MSTLRIGSLFSGYGGLEMGVRAVLGGEIAWHSEIEPAACRVLEHHHPRVPNLGDITAVDWSSVQSVDVLTAGYPCQPFSAAGRRSGSGDERYLWPATAHAIGRLRPPVFVGENVRGHLTLGFDEVVRDLSLLHYEVRWVVLRASDVGAPHGRARLFILGRDRGRQLRSGADRRGRLHRDIARQGSGHLCDQGGRGHGDQILPDPGCAEAALWRRVESDEAGDRAERTEGSLEGRGGRGVQGADCGAALPDPEEGPGQDRHGLARADHGEPGRTWPLPLVPAPTSGCGTGEAADPHAESARTRGGTDVAGCHTFRGVQVGSLVGAGRGPVRPGGVPGFLAGVGPDDRGTRLPTATAEHLAAWPAAGDAALLGRDAQPDAGAGEHRQPAGPSGGPGGAAAYADGPGCRAGAGLPGRHGAATVGDGPSSLADTAGAGRGRSAATVAGACSVTAGTGPLVQHGGRDSASADPQGDGRREGRSEPAGQLRGSDAALGGDEPSPDTDGDPVREQPVTLAGCVGAAVPGQPGAAAGQWGVYAPAIRRWERLLDRLAPAPTQAGKRGGQQLSPPFVEWLMGLPEGHVTAVPGLTRNEQLKLLGNGVVWQQAAAALPYLLAETERAAA